MCSSSALQRLSSQAAPRVLHSPFSISSGGFRHCRAATAYNVFFESQRRLAAFYYRAPPVGAGRRTGVHVRTRLGIADEHGRVVRRHQWLLRAMLCGLCVPRRGGTGIRVRGGNVQLWGRPGVVYDLPGGLLLRRRRGPPRRLCLRLIQRGGQRRLHALHLRRRLLLQCVVAEHRRLRRHDRLVRALLRRHGVHGRRRRANRLRRRQLLHAGRDVGGVHCLRRRRQLRPHRIGRVLQPKRYEYTQHRIPVPWRLVEPGVPWLRPSDRVHWLHE